MLVIALHVDVETAIVAQRVHERIDRTVAGTGETPFDVVDGEMRRQLLDGAVIRVVQRAVTRVADRQRRRDVLAVEYRAYVRGRQLLARGVGDLLHDLAEFDLQKTRQREPVVALEKIGDAALARLAVDANHRVVGASDVGGIDGQIGNVPYRDCRAPSRSRARRVPS